LLTVSKSASFTRDTCEERESLANNQTKVVNQQAKINKVPLIPETSLENSHENKSNIYTTFPAESFKPVLGNIRTRIQVCISMEKHTRLSQNVANIFF
jgi:hypothetical protein